MVSSSSAVSKSIASLGKKLNINRKEGVLARLGVDELVSYSRQIRRSFRGLEELAESIKVHGVQVPLIVRQVAGGKYEVLAGERRWRAARLAGLVDVPVLIRVVDDAEADATHKLENIQRENLDTLELAARVHEEVAAAGGNLDAVATSYGKSKAWVSKLATIASSGSLVGELVDEDVTSDRAVLATVASLEKKDEAAARALVDTLKEAPRKKVNMRTVATTHSKDHKGQRARSAGSTTKKAGRAAAGPAVKEPSWRNASPVRRNKRVLVGVQLRPDSEHHGEWKQLKRRHGEARIAIDKQHPTKRFALVEYGSSGKVTRAYRVEDLAIILVDETK